MTMFVIPVGGGLRMNRLNAMEKGLWDTAMACGDNNIKLRDHYIDKSLEISDIIGAIRRA